MSGLDYNFTIKDILVIFVIGIFQWQLYSISSRLDKLTDSTIELKIEMAVNSAKNTDQDKEIDICKNEVVEINHKLK